LGILVGILDYLLQSIDYWNFLKKDLWNNIFHGDNILIYIMWNLVVELKKIFERILELEDY